MVQSSWPGFLQHIAKDRANLRIVIHRIVAIDDYVWAHVQFMDSFNDDPQDLGIAGVDIFKMDADGKAIEHWDVLQEIGDPKNACSMQTACSEYQAATVCA